MNTMACNPRFVVVEPPLRTSSAALARPSSANTTPTRRRTTHRGTPLSPCARTPFHRNGHARRAADDRGGLEPGGRADGAGGGQWYAPTVRHVFLRTSS